MDAWSCQNAASLVAVADSHGVGLAMLSVAATLFTSPGLALASVASPFAVSLLILPVRTVRPRPLRTFLALTWQRTRASCRRSRRL